MQIFENEMFGSLRTIMIDGEPWFVGKDVAKALGYGNEKGNSKALNNAIADHVDEEDKEVTKMVTPGGKQRRQLLITKETVKLHDEYHEWSNKVITPLLDGIATYEQVADKLAVRKESYSALSLHYGYNVYYMRSEFINEQMDIAKQNGIDINRSEFEVAFLYIIYINEACRNIYEDMLTIAFSNVQKMQKQLQEVIA